MGGGVAAKHLPAPSQVAGWEQQRRAFAPPPEAPQSFIDFCPSLAQTGLSSRRCSDDDKAAGGSGLVAVPPRKEGPAEAIVAATWRRMTKRQIIL